jgi:CRP-like cAMP-binding protein
MPPLKQSDIKNGIIARIAPGDFSLLQVQLERLNMASGDILLGAAEPAKHVYFVEAGIISLLAPLEQGGRIEVGHVGREGAAGVHAALGADTLTSEVMAQSDGIIFRAESAAVRGLMERSPPLRQALTSFAILLYAQVSQTSACNTAHEVVQRLARWLLMVHDRTDGDTLNLTHEVISLMLGVTRPGVTIAAGSLQKSGLIQSTRGRLTIVDRPGLEAASCECYRIVAAYYAAERV